MNDPPLKNLIDAIPIPVYYRDKDGRFLKFNKAFETFFDASGKQLLGKTVAAICSPEYADVHGEMDALVLESGGMRQYESRVIAADGSVRDVIFRDAIFTDAQGAPEGLIGAVIDITERKRGENELKRNSDLLRATIEAAPTAIIGLDLDGNVHSVWNPAAEKMLGWSAEEVMGRPLPTVPSERQDEFRSFRDRIREGLTLDGVEVRRQRRDGTAIDYAIYASPLRDTEGFVTGNIAVLVDVTERKRAEEEIGKLSLATEQSPASIVITDTAGNIEYVNPKFTELTGYTREEVIGENPRILKTGETPPDEYRRLWDTIFRGEVWRGEFHNRKKDGELYWESACISPVKDPAGGITHFVAVKEDITARKRAEEALREREERYRTIFQNSPLGIFRSTFEGRFLEVNPAMARMLGYDSPEAAIRDILDIGKQVYINAEDRNRILSAQLRSADVVRHINRYRRKDGGEFLANLYMNTIRDGKGSPLFLDGIVEDITEQRTAEEDRGRIENALKFVAQCGWTASGEEFFPALARNLGEALDADYVMIDRLLPEQDAAETVALYARGAIVPNLRYDLRGTPCENVAGKTLCRYPRGVRELFPRDAALVEMEVESYVGVPLWDSAGRPIGLIAVMSRQPMANAGSLGDVLQVVATRAASELERERAEREKVKLNEQLVHAQKMEAVGRLAGGVAHDFNNMLNVILGQAELALLQITPDMPLHAKLQEIHKAAERSSNLTRQLLAFARKQTVIPRVLDVNETVQGILNMLRRMIGENIEFIWRPGIGILPVKIDPSQIDQILANLCVNAHDAITGVGTITIETCAATIDESNCAEHPGFVVGEYVLLAVSDDGCGMDKDTIDKLFEPFFTTKEKGKGTGLGLATVYGVVKQNNGFIDVLSEPGRGSTFKIYLPRSADEIARTREAAMPLPVSRNRETILLVEDEPATLNMAQRMLEVLEYRVLAASTPSEALRMAREHPGEIQLLITDVVMPEMNGKELAKVLIAQYPGQKTLYVSGYTADVIAHHGVLDEGIRFLEKPFSLQNLALKVRETLDAGQG